VLLGYAVPEGKDALWMAGLTVGTSMQLTTMYWYRQVMVW
jgi:hypothetical protein